MGKGGQEWHWKPQKIILHILHEGDNCSTFLVNSYSIGYIGYVKHICLNDQHNCIENFIFYLGNTLNANSKWNHAFTD